jgi:predicted phage-related endonuclease
MQLATVDEVLFQRERKEILGGTDMAALCGANKYKSRMQVWREKVGMEEPSEAGDTAEAGLILEPWLIEKARRLIEDRTSGGQTVVAALKSLRKEVEVPYYHLVRHPDYPFLGGHVDGFIIDAVNGEIIGLVECKAFGPYAAKDWGDPWTGECPERFLIQSQHYMGCNGFKSTLFMTFCWGQREAQPYMVERSDNLIATLQSVGVKFWNENVIPNVPPPIDGSEATYRLLREMYPADTGEVKLADDITAGWVTMLRQAIIESKRVDGRVLEAKNHILDFIGDASILDTPEGPLTYKKSKDGEAVDYKAAIVQLRTILPVKELRILDQVIADNTSVKEGSRRFLTPREWTKEADDA